MKIFNPKIGIALELSPIFVAGDQCYLFDWKSCLEQTACSLVTQIVGMRGLSILSSAHARGECRAYRFVVMGEYPSIASEPQSAAEAQTSHAS